MMAPILNLENITLVMIGVVYGLGHYLLDGTMWLSNVSSRRCSLDVWRKGSQAENDPAVIQAR